MKKKMKTEKQLGIDRDVKTVIQRVTHSGAFSSSKDELDIHEKFFIHIYTLLL